MKIVLCHGPFRISDAAFDLLPADRDELFYFDNRHDPDFVGVVQRLGSSANDGGGRFELIEWNGDEYHIDCMDPDQEKIRAVNVDR